MKTILFHSGSLYSGDYPEHHLKHSTIMMSYFEIKNKLVKQHKRFQAIRKKRRENLLS